MNKTDPPSRPSTSRAFVLRCWHDKDTSDDAALTWHFMLEEICQARRRWGFVSFEKLTAHLREELETEA